MAKKKEEKSFEIAGQKVRASDVIEVSRIPQTNEDLYHTTKGSFPGSLVPQEFADAVAAAGSADEG